MQTDLMMRIVIFEHFFEILFPIFSQFIARVRKNPFGIVFLLVLVI